MSMMIEYTVEKLTAKALERGVPRHLCDGLSHWIVSARPTGDFLRAVLSNNLKKAFWYGDDKSIANLNEIMTFLFNDVPSACWGSEENVAEWRGLSSLVG